MSLEEAYRTRCPSCDMLVDAVESHAFLPFCSERCRLIDLGRWLNEEHALPCDDDNDDDAGESEQSLTSDSQRGDSQIGESPVRRPPPKLPPGWHDA